MIFRKQNKKDSRYLATTSGLSLRETPVWGDLWRLFWWGISIFTFISLVSYSAADPSWTTWSTRSVFRNWLGRTGSIISDLLFQLFGLTSFFLILVMIRFGKNALRDEDTRLTKTWSITANTVFVLSLSTLIQALIPRKWIPWQFTYSGGIVGELNLSFWKYLTGPFGAVLVSFVFALASSILLFRWKAITQLVSVLQRIKWEARQKGSTLGRELLGLLIQKLKPLFKKTPPIAAGTAPAPIATPAPVLAAPVIPPKQLDLPSASKEPEISTLPAQEDDEVFSLMSGSRNPTFTESKPKRKNMGPFQIPPVAMLSGKAESKVKAVDKSWYLDKANILVEKLRDFGVEGEVVHISPGPVITVYEFKPASGVKIKDIANLSDDLTLALSVLSVRIVAPIPGKPVVGIEIPSPHREMVFFKDLIQETPFYNDEIRIPIALGRLASGEPVTADLAAMPHLLVAGATGTGKSVFINTLISSLLFRFTPQQLKLILVDPKMVELSLYEGVPHLLLPVVVDSKKAALALRWTVDEMERRYTLMHQAGVRHIDGYNARISEIKAKGETEEDLQPIPYIVVV
ncbi:DNA translocase FtsK, partial [bacterium]|nr:DNA translocase FtsK [bacterium]